MSLQIHGTVIQRSNGTLVILPVAGSAADRLVLSESALGSKHLPAMGDTITIKIEVTTPAASSQAEAPQPAHASEGLSAEASLAADEPVPTERRKR